MTGLTSIKDLHFLPSTETMPALFIGHGNPMNAIEHNEFSNSWEELGRILPKPKAILCISAHWETKGTFVNAALWPEIIHDFYGFPQALFDVRYPAPGDPMLAENISAGSGSEKILLTEDWGLDHGCWSVLVRMYPDAKIPVLQLSIDHYLSPAQHFQLAHELAFLRKKGVLIIGSGNMVHNLRMFDFFNPDKKYEWALSMNEYFKSKILEGNANSLMDLRRMGKDFELAAPTLEHYIPMLYILALKENDEIPFIFNDAVLSSLSMTSFLLTTDQVSLH